MTEEIFINQVVEFRLQSKISLAGSTSVKIHFWKPDGVTEGDWTATVDGQEIVYTTTNSDLDQSGDWKFQAVATYPAGDKYGRFAYKTVKDR